MKCVTEVFSRVTGFFRPVQTWNKGKNEEFKDRKSYNLKNKKKKIDHQDYRMRGVDDDK